eukprot:358051-Chlamydomonas_euryale.AAC.3
MAAAHGPGDKRGYRLGHPGLLTRPHDRGTRRRTSTCTGARWRRGWSSKTSCPRALRYRVYVVPALLYALLETSGLTDLQLQPLVSA